MATHWEAIIGASESSSVRIPLQSYTVPLMRSYQHHPVEVGKMTGKKGFGWIAEVCWRWTMCHHTLNCHDFAHMFRTLYSHHDKAQHETQEVSTCSLSNFIQKTTSKNCWICLLTHLLESFHAILNPKKLLVTFVFLVFSRGKKIEVSAFQQRFDPLR